MYCTIYIVTFYFNYHVWCIQVRCHLVWFWLFVLCAKCTFCFGYIDIPLGTHSPMLKKLQKIHMINWKKKSIISLDEMQKIENIDNNQLCRRSFIKNINAKQQSQFMCMYGLVRRKPGGSQGTAPEPYVLNQKCGFAWKYDTILIWYQYHKNWIIFLTGGGAMLASYSGSPVRPSGWYDCCSLFWGV